ncbi:tripartite tricarboxylate transporter substrate binding protein [Nitratireductor indicus]|uniref:tripartite tricarboxylate transporter substrate binding protein n=1 Tax=Nitratireductor indicus TaxID=721133 RepID=UPI002875ACE2|nr:tripartite tricarboxylate transporter substrate binding protein [Nitratireductor indicus]MDS1137450.1 tripartite tricarboxylate transporter substrate binding protein [Nitratireductor indicus]
MNRLFKSAAMACVAAFGLGVAPAMAEYPEKPVEMVVPYAPGGSTDVLARKFAQYAEKYLGKPMVVVNKPGAGGQLGFTAISTAKADGYTIGWINSGIITNAITRPDVKFSVDTYDMVANLVTDPGVLSVTGDSGINTLEEFIAAAKKEKLTVSHEGVGGDDFLAVLQLEQAAGIELNKVAFNGDAEAKAALLGGHINAIEGNVSEQVEMASEGGLKPLVVWSKKTAADMPDVPTGAALGYNILSAASRGIAGPKGMEPEALEKLREVATKVANDPEFIEDLKKLNMPMDVMIGDEYLTFMKEQDKAYRDLWEKNPWM